MKTHQHRLLFDSEIIVDLFAGGGGLSSACEAALGRSPDIAINHNDDALSMHRQNHPQTNHFVADVFEVCPHGATQGRPVGYLHLSPDCTHHSQAAGGQPRDERIRALTWVGRRWAGQVKPRVITLENVRQILKWGPLVAKRCSKTGRVMRMDGTVAGPGEHTPRSAQFLVPDPKRQGITWHRFVRSLQGMGYVVEHRVINAADHGAGTTRERLFMVARCDGQPIVWPTPTHYKKPARGQKRWVAAADSIDWSIPCPSIFDRPKPLADATLRRIARGVQRFVLDSGHPFIVNMAHGVKLEPISEPVSTIATEKGGCRALAAATLVQTGYGEREGQAPRTLDITEPIGTIVGTGKHAVAAAYLSQQQLVTCTLDPHDEAGALRVAAFLTTYYGNGQECDPRHPMNTVTTRDRLAIVTVTLEGTPYVITDIGLRMLTPRELYRAQGFPPEYEIEHGHDGRRFTKSAQVRMVGNSVSPPPAAAIIAANCGALRTEPPTAPRLLQINLQNCLIPYD